MELLIEYLKMFSFGINGQLCKITQEIGGRGRNSRACVYEGGLRTDELCALTILVVF